MLSEICNNKSYGTVVTAFLDATTESALHQLFYSRSKHCSRRRNSISTLSISAQWLWRRRYHNPYDQSRNLIIRNLAAVSTSRRHFHSDWSRTRQPYQPSSRPCLRNTSGNDESSILQYMPSFWLAHKYQNANTDELISSLIEMTYCLKKNNFGVIYVRWIRYRGL